MTEVNQNELDRLACIEAAKELLDKKITLIIQDADFTPKGKRRFKIVSHKLNGQKTASHIRLYVARQAYRNLALTKENLNAAKEWAKA